MRIKLRKAISHGALLAFLSAVTPSHVARSETASTNKSILVSELRVDVLPLTSPITVPLEVVAKWDQTKTNRSGGQSLAIELRSEVPFTLQLKGRTLNKTAGKRVALKMNISGARDCINVRAREGKGPGTLYRLCALVVGNGLSKIDDRGSKLASTTRFVPELPNDSPFEAFSPDAQLGFSNIAVSTQLGQPRGVAAELSVPGVTGALSFSWPNYKWLRFGVNATQDFQPLSRPQDVKVLFSDLKLYSRWLVSLTDDFLVPRLVLGLGGARRDTYYPLANNALVHIQALVAEAQFGLHWTDLGQALRTHFLLDWTLEAMGSYVLFAPKGGTAKGYSVSVLLSYHFFEWIAAGLSFRYSRDQVTPENTTSPDLDQRAQKSFGLVFSFDPWGRL